MWTSRYFLLNVTVPGSKHEVIMSWRAAEPTWRVHIPLFHQWREKTDILRTLRTDVCIDDGRDLMSCQLMSILVHQELTWPRKVRLSYLRVIINTAEGPTHQLPRSWREEREGGGGEERGETIAKWRNLSTEPSRKGRGSSPAQSSTEKAGAGVQDPGGELLVSPINHFYWLQQKGKGANKEPPKWQARHLLPTNPILTTQLCK